MSAQPAKRRPGRPSGSSAPALSEAESLDRALEAFAARGFEGTSLREIAQQCGISHGLLTARFGSKPALWAAAVDHGMNRLYQRMIEVQSAFPEGASVEQRLLLACRDFLHSVADFPAIIQVMNIEGVQRGPRLDYIVETFFHGRSWPIATLIEEGQAAGIFRQVHVTVPFTLLAHGAGALVALRPLIETVDTRLAREPGSIARAIEESATLIVQGLRRDTTPPAI